MVGSPHPEQAKTPKRSWKSLLTLQVETGGHPGRLLRRLQDEEEEEEGEEDEEEEEEGEEGEGRLLRAATNSDR